MGKAHKNTNALINELLIFKPYFINYLSFQLANLAFQYNLVVFPLFIGMTYDRHYQFHFEYFE